MPQRKKSAYVNGPHDCEAIASIIFTLNDTQENIAIYCSLCLVGFLDNQCRQCEGQFIFVVY